jgi:hypothetical protein
MSAQAQELKVFISSRESPCDECGQALGRSAWVCLLGERGALCLSCADLDRLVFLPAGDVALTRRARKHSTLSPPLNPNGWPMAMLASAGPSATPRPITMNCSRRAWSEEKPVAGSKTGCDPSSPPGNGPRIAPPPRRRHSAA